MPRKTSASRAGARPRASCDPSSASTILFDLPLDGSTSQGGWDPLPLLQEQGVAIASPDAVAALAQVPREALDALVAAWDRLPPDRHLRDGGAYRHRRHASYVQALSPARLERVPHRAHWQPTEYNALHGGIERWFEPVEDTVAVSPVWQGLIAGLGRLFAAASGDVDRWYVEAHQFRIDTAQGIGRPTPEGAHRDGVDYVAVILVARHDVRGGETRIFEAEGPRGMRFTLADPWTALLLDDARVIHETTPIQPAATPGWRDTLVLTFRRGGFLAPARG